MTTDQIKRTEEAVHADEVDATNDAAAVLDAAQDEAKQILAKARYEAFRMVTDARSEAESILTEAETAVPELVILDHDTSEAEQSAAEIIAAAQEKATTIVEEAEHAAAMLYETSRSAVEQQTAVLRERHAALEAQVAATQSLLASLEERLARIAGAEAPAPAPAPEPKPRSVGYSLAGEVDPAVLAQEAAQDEQSDPDPLPPAAAATSYDYSASVPAAVTTDQPSVPVDPTEQGSFYSRRSAKLPSIGASGGQDALSTVRSLRSKMGPSS